MTDKELIELAAKAAGIEVEEDAHIPSGGIWISELDGHKPWSPLTDDGDALRLAVKLKIKFERHIAHPFVAAFAPGIVGRFEEQESEDAYSATRRAIVRAAAQIGKEM